MRVKKYFGQHFLEPVWADKLMAAIDPQPSDRFLEIGPGPGALTLRLAGRAAHVTAVEVDSAMISTLRPRLPGNVTLIHADFLDFDVMSLSRGAPLRVAGNLPYNVSSPILFKLLAAHGGLTDATLMVQREVAERIEAEPGGREYGVPAILVRLHADVRRMLTLPPGAFRPPPQVHSAVLHLRFRAPAVALADEAVFEAMVRSMFTRRRKMLQNALKPFAELCEADASEALAAAGIDPRRRAETLQLAEFARLAEFFVSATRRAVL
jgi:16S rRNA (adenine1518-N6/adenine1519-N6)-dimethyltransferase